MMCRRVWCLSGRVLSDCLVCRKSWKLAVLEMCWFMLRCFSKRLGVCEGWVVDFGSAFCKVGVFGDGYILILSIDTISFLFHLRTIVLGNHLMRDLVGDSGVVSRS